MEVRPDDMDQIFDSLERLLENPMEKWILACLAVGVLSLVVSFGLHRKLLTMDPGNERMQKIAAAIRTGAMAFLRTQYTILAVFAHPGLARNEQLPDELAGVGVDGLEAIHSRHSETARQRYLRFGQEHGLLVTGGSDCHGMSKGKPLIGGIKLPIHYVHKLQQAREKRVKLSATNEHK